MDSVCQAIDQVDYLPRFFNKTGKSYGCVTTENVLRVDSIVDRVISGCDDLQVASDDHSSTLQHNKSTQPYLEQGFMRILATILMCCLPISGQCDDAAECRHQTIVVRSRPVIERLPLKVIDPIDVVITKFGATVVAERQAGIVFLLSEDGQTSILAQDQVGLSRVANSGVTGLHSLCSRKSSSTIHRITDSGFASEFAELPFKAAGLAAGEAGGIWTTNSTTAEIIYINAAGQRKTVKRLNERIIDITADDQGAYVLKDSGEIISVGSDGSSLRIGYVSNGKGSQANSRIQLRPDHQVVALTKAADGSATLQEPQAKEGEGRPVGKVPTGTQAFAFDALGNLTLANPDLRALTRVTSHFTVPCPHCGKPVPMTLSPDAPAPAAKRRSF
ncbi:MAG: hypothetical protein ABJZ55_18280 [Fuerstiella sp.]